MGIINLTPFGYHGIQGDGGGNLGHLLSGKQVKQPQHRQDHKGLTLPPILNPIFHWYLMSA